MFLILEKMCSYRKSQFKKSYYNEVIINHLEKK